MAKTATKKPITKTELFTAIAETCEEDVTKKEVAAVFAALETVVAKQVGRRGPGVVNIAGLIKVARKKVPSRPARKGVPNPFKPGELMDIKARPASTKVKVLPLKKLKDMVA